MKYIIAIVLLFTCNMVCAAVTKADAKAVYAKITSENNIWVHPRLKFSNDNRINASSTLQYITINQGMLDNTDINELAFILGHELAHAKLLHFGSSHKNEYAADKLGYYYGQKAGYNMCAAMKIFKKFGQRTSKTHPHPKDRVNRLPKC